MIVLVDILGIHLLSAGTSDCLLHPTLAMLAAGACRGHSLAWCLHSTQPTLLPCRPNPKP